MTLALKWWASPDTFFSPQSSTWETQTNPWFGQWSTPSKPSWPWSTEPLSTRYGKIRATETLKLPCHSSTYTYFSSRSASRLSSASSMRKASWSLSNQASWSCPFTRVLPGQIKCSRSTQWSKSKCLNWLRGKMMTTPLQSLSACRKRNLKYKQSSMNTRWKRVETPMLMGNHLVAAWSKVWSQVCSVHLSNRLISLH